MYLKILKQSCDLSIDHLSPVGWRVEQTGTEFGEGGCLILPGQGVLAPGEDPNHLMGFPGQADSHNIGCCVVYYNLNNWNSLCTISTKTMRVVKVEGSCHS